MPPSSHFFQEPHKAYSVLLALFAILSCNLALSAASAKRPNVLFIMSDDHAYEAVGAYDSWLKDFLHTPTLDKLAAEGMRFTNACCNNSICSPSRASIISGQYSHVNGGLNLGCGLRPDAPTYVGELTKAGYETCVVGKWHMKQFPRGAGTYAVTKGQGKYFNPTFHRPDGSTEKHQGYYADRYADRALRWLKEERDKSKPFYLSLHFKGPHESFEYPERWAHLHEGVNIPEPDTLHEDVYASSPHLKGLHYSTIFDAKAPKSYYYAYLRDMPRRSNDPRERRSIGYQHLIHKFIRCVAAIDDNVKRVLDHLAAEGLLDDTLVLYTSDQGYFLGQHNMHDKRLILETSLKMPLIIRYPKEIKPGTVNHKLVSNIDFGPSMLDFAGVPVPAAMQGRSFRPLLRGETPTNWRKALFYAYYARAPMHWGIRTETHKLVKFPHVDEIEFYDLVDDPHETKERSAEPGYSELIKQTEARLGALMKEVGVTKEFLLANMKNNKRSAPKSFGSRKASPKKN